MHTQRIKGVEALAIDKKVLAITKKHASPWDAGSSYRIALRNGSGVICRTIDMDSLGIYFGIREDLLALGLLDEVVPNGKVDGFDAVLSLPAQVSPREASVGSGTLDQG